MAEAKSNCTGCGCQILQSTADRNDGLCAVCLQKDQVRDHVDSSLQSPRPVTRELLDQWILNVVPRHGVINALFNAACWKVNFAPGTLTDGDVIVYTVWTFLGESCNGGLMQYFDNQSGTLAHRCGESLRRIGADKYASLVEASIAAFTRAASADDPRWQVDLEAYEADLEEPFGEWDDKFSEYYWANPEEVPALLFEFVCQNRSLFS